MTGLPLIGPARARAAPGPELRVRGLDVAGVVEAVGAASRASRPATRSSAPARGTFAEYARVREDRAAPQARQPDLRAGRRRARLRVHGAAGAARPRQGHRRPAGAGHRRGRRHRDLRRPARQGLRRARHRRLQHRQDRPGPRARRGRGRRLHAARPLTGTYDLVLDIAGNRPLAELRRLLTPARHAGPRRRRGRRPLARRHGTQPAARCCCPRSSGRTCAGCSPSSAPPTSSCCAS